MIMKSPLSTDVMSWTDYRTFLFVTEVRSVTLLRSQDLLKTARKKRAWKLLSLPRNSKSYEVIVSRGHAWSNKSFLHVIIIIDKQLSGVCLWKDLSTGYILSALPFQNSLHVNCLKTMHAHGNGRNTDYLVRMLCNFCLLLVSVMKPHTEIRMCVRSGSIRKKKKKL